VSDDAIEPLEAASPAHKRKAGRSRDPPPNVPWSL
jgi:hypothetical protein